MIKTIRENFELIFWITAILALAFSNPASDSHFSLCLFKWIGIGYCPGCGIGHAIGWLLHGDLKASFNAHWLGVPALLIIFYRVICLSFQQMFTFRKLNS